ncbi:MAG TPA: hypothetical protein VGK48_22525 [Terriglobia bacterium]
MTIDIAAFLPAGEWAEIRTLNKPPGMMADHNWAIFARARWLRDGGKPGFIKFIVRAGSKAGADTEMITGHDRLKGVFDRLVSLQAFGLAIPLVPLFEVQLKAEGLLVAMEELEPLHDIIKRGEAYSLSLKILEDLDPEKDKGPSWLHFDICPMNIGVLANGRCVLIDVESFYLEKDDVFQVSIPAWKPFRAPQDLVDKVQDQLATGSVDKSTAYLKQRYEIALAAAECVLGPLAPHGNLTSSVLKTWLSAADPKDRAVQFWARTLQAALDNGQIRPIRELHDELQSSLSEVEDVDHAPLVHEPVLPPISIGEGAVPSAPGGGPEGWEEDWNLLKPAAYALRAGKLENEQLPQYRLALERLARKYPSQRLFWNELLLVAISYEKNAAEALAYANEALQHLRDDPDLNRMRNIIQRWVTERQNG